MLFINIYLVFTEIIEKVDLADFETAIHYAGKCKDLRIYLFIYFLKDNVLFIYHTRNNSIMLDLQNFSILKIDLLFNIYLSIKIATNQFLQSVITNKARGANFVLRIKISMARNVFFRVFKLRITQEGQVFKHFKTYRLGSDCNFLTYIASLRLRPFIARS